MNKFYQITLPLIMFLITTSLVSIAVGSDEFSGEKSALVALKSNITHDPFNIVTKNWSTTTSYCNWFGVTCITPYNKVVSLDLSNMLLEAKIPPEVGDLSFLEYINFSNNSFFDHIPEEFSRLSELKFLNLGYNNLSGEIPASLGNLSKLEHLHLAHNELSGSIPLSVYNMTSLKTLILSRNYLTGNVPEEITKLTNLERLNLKRNRISGPVPGVIFNMSSLRRVNFFSNTLSGRLQADSCSDLSKLEWFELSGNEVYGEIPLALFRCKELRAFTIHGNKMYGNLPLEIRNLTKLQVLFLGSNSFTGNIPEEIGYLVNMQHLGLESNNFQGGMPAMIVNCTGLIRLSMHSNNLTGPLPSNIGFQLQNLKEFHVAVNAMSGPIPESICNASKLVILSLSINSFYGYIPESLGNLRNLRHLGLNDNLLTNRPSTPELTFLSSLTNSEQLNKIWLDQNQLHGKLPDSVGNLSTTLQDFSIYNCSITGRIPEGIGNLSNLIKLIADYNEFIGPFQETIGRLKNLQALTLTGNKLEGPLPNKLCHLDKMTYLYFTNNRLQGPIPDCIGSLTYLREIDISFNNISGTIPPTLWGLKDILLVNFSSNSLGGSLPLEIKNLEVVVLLDLSRNQLSGEIPISISGLENVVNLSFSGNRFQGQIPETFGDMVSLEMLDLSDNRLSGLIPKSLKKLKNLKYFNVSFNSLEGEVPDGGPFLNFSARSFMGNKALCGPPNLQVQPCITRKRHESSWKRRLIYGYILPQVLVMVIIAGIIIAFIRLRRKKPTLPVQQVDDHPHLTSWRRISHHELQLATSGFNHSNLLGRGSFGSVYKGILLDGTAIAVKVFSSQLDKAFTSFETECDVLRNLRHRNLVKIITSCSNPDFKALVLQFFPNWSLEKWLHNDDYFLDMHQRLNIMVDVASALEYLHHGYSTPIVHCDIKPSNVLLDENMVASVTDFGIAKLIGGGDSMTRTMTLATIGYMAPEYGSEGMVSIRGDVYSYGILLMETFTGKSPTDEMFTGDSSLKLWVSESLPNAFTEVVDANLLNPEDNEKIITATKKCFTSVFELALQCCADLPHERIRMQEVVASLKKINAQFQRDVKRSNFMY